MAGNRNKAEAAKRLASMGLAPAYVQEEEAAAIMSMSVGAFRKWQERDAEARANGLPPPSPAAPKPYWFGENCKRYKVSELTGAGGPPMLNPWDEDAA